MLKHAVHKKECTTLHKKKARRRESARLLIVAASPKSSINEFLVKYLQLVSLWFDGMKLLWREGNLWLVPIVVCVCVWECVRVIGSFSQCSCSVSLNLSDGHWEAFLFLQWRLTVDSPRMLVAKRCEAFRPRRGEDWCVFLKADTDFSERLYGGPEMPKFKTVGSVQCLVWGCTEYDGGIKSTQCPMLAKLRQRKVSISLFPVFLLC